MFDGRGPLDGGIGPGANPSVVLINNFFEELRRRRRANPAPGPYHQLRCGFGREVAMDRKQTQPVESTSNEPRPAGLTRRDFLEGTGAALVAAGASPTVASAGPGSTGAASLAQQVPAVPSTRITLTVNGTRRTVQVEDRWSLNELLRDHLRLIGSKIGCNRGECGACTVLLDGEPVYSCSTLAVWADGRSIVTVEGLEQNGEVSPLQQAFMDYNAPQCGFCTPGQLMAATALLERNPDPTDVEVREALVGNLCRCSNYNSIVEAVLAAAPGGAR
jgi:aerobic-type carbon monoxide dehydrogenase small subunit (CoxS/CutS family)